MNKNYLKKFNHIINHPSKISGLDLSNKEQLFLVKHNPLFFTYLKNPCKQVIQFLSINDPSRLVSYIRIAPFEQQKIMIKNHPNLIKFIKEPNYELQLTAFKSNVLSINDIYNPDNKLIDKFINYILKMKDLHFQQVYFNLFYHFKPAHLLYLLKTKNPELIEAIQKHKLFKNTASIIIEVINE